MEQWQFYLSLGFKNDDSEAGLSIIRDLNRTLIVDFKWATT